VRTVLRPRPLEGVHGERVAFFGTAPPAQHDVIARHLEDGFGARVVHVSGSLSDRGALARELERLDADTLVVEIKAAAIDVVAEHADRTGRRLVIAGNDVVPLPGEDDLDRLVERLAVEATERLAVGV
jgi:cyclic 2,3-diphosphoglycerate synthetase